ncbi:MAG: two-component sensor histidine kinase [Planctomycetes bacterium HGW-Planctomycetes-1]|nr:MAG: two-component sensor histidine kinase [Planctomycetes bacterium HGW-Planctomycetes-1]
MFHNRRKNTQAQTPKVSELEELSRLTGGLAHEIKNPLSIIKVNLKLISEELASKEANPARAARKIDVVRKETDRLEQILEDFLRYIRKTELHPVSVDINQLVMDMADFYSPQAASRSITLRVALDSGQLICKADADMLKQVLLNLFINAQQAMPDGGDLMLRTQKNGPNAVIIVSDTGKGIEPENLNKIFDAYYSTKSGGSGLGLPTSRKIIEAHNGSIRVDSVLQKGSSFTIQLPLEEK